MKISQKVKDKIANSLEKVGHKLLELWYLDFAFIIAGMIIIYLAFRLRHHSRRGDEVDVIKQSKMKSMAYAFLIAIAIIVLILYVLQPGTEFEFSAFGKQYTFTVTSVSTSTS